MPTPSIPSFLPQPFDWCKIDAGYTKISTHGFPKKDVTVSIDTFFISKYPITYAQYRVFVDEPDGYANPNWWGYSQNAMQWRIENPQPYHYTAPDDYPRTAVTWYESVVFTRWLSHQCKATISLPNEAQWKRAAQGDTGWLYPYGDTFDATKCNCNMGEATPVTHYMQGASPFGVVDMVGNVWEWTLTNAINGRDEVNDVDAVDDCTFIICGGSWKKNTPQQVSVEGRTHIYPEDAIMTCGFRIIYAG